MTHPRMASNGEARNSALLNVCISRGRMLGIVIKIPTPVMAQYGGAQYYPGVDMSGPMRSSRQSHRSDPYHNPYGPQHRTDFWSTDPRE